MRAGFRKVDWCVELGQKRSRRPVQYRTICAQHSATRFGPTPIGIRRWPLGDRHYALSAVSGLVGDFHDRLAEDIFDRLMSYLRGIRYTLLRQKLVAEHSYAAAGQCFLRLIEDRKRHFLVP
jgi:hypothetical protein